MRPTLTVTLKSDNCKFAWLRWVTGFDMRAHCAMCLKGGYHDGARWTRDPRPPAGHVAELILDPVRSDFWYFCVVSYRGYHDNHHTPMRVAPDASFRREDDNVILVGKGVEPLVIPELPLDVVRSGFSLNHKRCRNWIWACATFPDDRVELPPPQG